jgi:hypothetical protein
MDRSYMYVKTYLCICAWAARMECTVVGRHYRRVAWTNWRCLSLRQDETLPHSRCRAIPSMACEKRSKAARRRLPAKYRNAGSIPGLRGVLPSALLSTWTLDTWRRLWWAIWWHCLARFRWIRNDWELGLRAVISDMDQRCLTRSCSRPSARGGRTSCTLDKVRCCSIVLNRSPRKPSKLRSAKKCRPKPDLGQHISAFLKICFHVLEH